MELKTKVDELVLALMSLNKFVDGQTTRAWKILEESLDRLEKQKYIRNDAQTKSVLFTSEGLSHAEACFKKHILDNG